jgi:putative membrane protein
MGLLVRLIVNAATISLAAALIPGIELRGFRAVVIAALVFGIINAFVRPVLVILTFPPTLVTLGLFIFVLNAFCLWLTSPLVPGFDIQGFVPALLGALVISAVSWLLSAFVR